MPFNVELTEEETLCLHRYFERVDETEDLSFRHPAEHLAFQSIAGQVCRANSMMKGAKARHVLEEARAAIVRDSRAGLEWGRRSIPHFGEPIAMRESADAADPTQVNSEQIESDPLRARVETVMRICIARFEAGDPDGVAALLARDARIVSPLGCHTACDFLPHIVAGGSSGARLTLHDVRMNVEGRPQALGYFLYDGWGSYASAKKSGVYHCVLNIDPVAMRVQSMIIL